MVLEIAREFVNGVWITRVHDEGTGTGTQPPTPFIQDADPGAVGEGAIWVDTSGVEPVVKVRDTADAGWIVVGSGIPQGGAAHGGLIPYAARRTGSCRRIRRGDITVQLPAASGSRGAGRRLVVDRARRCRTVGNDGRDHDQRCNDSRPSVPSCWVFDGVEWAMLRSTVGSSQGGPLTADLIGCGIGGTCVSTRADGPDGHAVVGHVGPVTAAIDYRRGRTTAGGGQRTIGAFQRCGAG